MTSTPPAAMTVKGTCSSWAKSEASTVTGREAMVVVKSRAKRNSPHDAMKAKMPTATSPGVVTGRNTRKSAPSGVHPSTRAARSRSRGTV